jgi:SagB-type dehydrogenase family enzyme
MKDRIGDLFQQETKYLRGKLPDGHLDWRNEPETYKTYPGVPKVALEAPLSESGMPLWEAFKKRRSVRDFQEKILSKGALSQLLWASQGISKKLSGYELRTAPSAGALYPIETYLVLGNIEGIEPGIYHFDVKNHALDELRRGDLRPEAASAALEQKFMAGANIIFIWTAVFNRSKWKYRERAYRYVYLDAGHIAQNVALAAVGLGLGSCQIAALFDDEVNSLIQVDGIEESVVYMAIVGWPKR